jgi:hypothetical protein
MITYFFIAILANALIPAPRENQPKWEIDLDFFTFSAKFGSAPKMPDSPLISAPGNPSGLRRRGYPRGGALPVQCFIFSRLAEQFRSFRPPTRLKRP